MGKTIISLEKQFTDLLGEDLTGLTLGKYLAASLSNSTQGNALKYFGWSIDLHAGKAIDLDDSDFKDVYQFVENGQIPVLYKAQLLKALDAAKESSKKQSEGDKAIKPGKDKKGE